MDRIINVKVSGNYVSKDNKVAGVRGEGNVTTLRITFDAGWYDYSKTVTFFDARGENPVKVILTTNISEKVVDKAETYRVPIPQEPMMVAGMLTFVIDGVIEGKRQRSLSDQLEVKDAPIADDAVEPTDPTATPYEQLQAEFEAVKGDILSAAENATKAENSMIEAAEYANIAEEAVGKTSFIGDNGNWYEWNSEKNEFYDTGVKAQAGSTVYVGENPPDNADVWLKPTDDVEVSDDDEIKEKVVLRDQTTGRSFILYVTNGELRLKESEV